MDGKASSQEANEDRVLLLELYEKCQEKKRRESLRRERNPRKVIFKFRSR